LNIKEFICKALGDKEYKEDDHKSDCVCSFRLMFVLINIVTCIFIIANAIRHW